MSNHNTCLVLPVPAAAELAEIKAGRATQLLNGDIQTSSGRIYGRHQQSPAVFPRGGPGNLNRTQAEFDVYRKIVESGGLTGNARTGFDGMSRVKNGGLSADSEQKLVDLFNSRS